MLNRQTIKKATIINLQQASEACELAAEYEPKFITPKFTFDMHIDKLNSSDTLSNEQFCDLISEISKDLQALDLPK